MSVSKFLQVYRAKADKLHDELESVQENLKSLYDYKEEIVSKIERKKLWLRQTTDSNKLYKQHKRYGETQEKYKISMMLKEKFLSHLDKEISLIQNQYDIIYNELKKMKRDLQEKIKIVDKIEIVMNVLTYKIYEVRYDFRAKINSLKEAKVKLTSESLSGKNESEVALQRVEIEKDISEYELLYESQMRSIKGQKLEAQKQYEDAVNILDNNLDNIRKYYNVLLLLIQAEKEQLSDLQNEIANVKYSIVLDSLQKDIDYFTELQTGGWRTKQPLEKNVRITYDEARDQNLLDDITFSLDFLMDKGKDEVSSKGSKEDCKDSEYSRMSSEDVQYLRENLGTPLTLALAEITAVQPKDPIHYLGHWLFKYKYNQEMADIKKTELQQIIDERERVAKEKWQKLVQEEAKFAVLECIVRAEEELARKELLRIQMQLESTEEEVSDPWEMELRDKFDGL